jgi:peptidyl-prolyl cis-trans isomerase D
MIAFFRRFLNSKMTIVLLGLLMLGFIVTGVGTPSSLAGLGGGGTDLASVGSKTIGATEMKAKLSSAIKNLRQQNPTLDMPTYLKSGALENMINELTQIIGVSLFGENNGMIISRKLVDGRIASIPAFAGATGNFSDDTYKRMLAENDMDEGRFRSEVAASITQQHMLTPVAAAPYVPKSFALVYGSMKLQQRTGLVITLPASAFIDKTVPSDADLNKFYQNNAGRYTVPELRVVRYARFDRSRFEGKVAPTEKEVQDYFGQNAQRFASKETRGLTQVIVQDGASATKIAAAAKAGGSMAAAAKASGVDALTIAPIEQGPLSGQSSVAVAAAVFAAKSGTVVGPIKSGLGWHVIKIDVVNVSGGKTIDQARPEIVKELTKVKTDEAVQNFADGLDDMTSDGKTFDEVVKANGLTAEATPRLDQAGLSPDNKEFKLTPDLSPLLKEAFGMDPEEDATTATLGEGRFVFFKLAEIVPTAPRPLAQIKTQVTEDFIADRASRAARTAAEGIVAKVNRGVPLGTALAEAGAHLPAPQKISAKYLEMRQAGEKAPPPIRALFEIALHKSKAMPLPNNGGWVVVWVDTNQAGDASNDPKLIEATSGELAELYSGEYAEQFGKAATKASKVKRYDDNIATFKRGLTGTGTQ